MRTTVHFDPLIGRDATFKLSMKLETFTIKGKEITLEVPTWSSQSSEFEYIDPDYGDLLEKAWAAYHALQQST